MDIKPASRDGVYEITTESLQVNVRTASNRLVVFRPHYQRAMDALSWVGKISSRMPGYDRSREVIEVVVAELADCSTELIRVLLIAIKLAGLLSAADLCERIGRGVTKAGHATSTSSASGTATVEP